MQKKIHIFLAFCLAVTLFGCKGNAIFSESHEIAGLNWDVNDTQTFEADLPASGDQAFDIVGFIRRASNCPVENLALHYKITLPDGAVQEKTVSVVLRNGGKNTGEGLGDIWDTKPLLLSNVKFPTAGKVKIEISHQMQNPKVPLVIKIGADIVKQ
jgi:gliding motility-associated lipoprotein GldH